MVTNTARSTPAGAVKEESTALQEVHETAKSSIIGVTDHWSNIATRWTLVTLPMTALTIAFLVMVFKYRVHHNNGPYPNLRLPVTENDENYVYVDLDASTILFVASWASSLAPMLSGFFMALASFPIARLLLSNIRAGRVSAMPTPYQLGLTLKFVDGSALGAIWSWIVYLVSWRKTRQPQTPILVVTSSIAVFVVILG